MKNLNIIMISLLAFLVVGGGVVYVMNTQSNPDTKQTNNNQSSTEVVNESSSSDLNSANQNYVEYSDNYLETTSGTRLLFFHASWCPQCRALDADILENGLPKDVTVVKVDFDNSTELRQKYGVTVQTTVVKVDDDGNLVDKYTPYDEPTFENVKQNLL